jgi:hypothetical protein
MDSYETITNSRTNNLFHHGATQRDAKKSQVKIDPIELVFNAICKAKIIQQLAQKQSNQRP